MPNPAPKSNTPFLQQQIRSIAEQDATIDTLWIYGSQATNSADSNSDYDFAVAFAGYIKDPLQRRLRVESLAMAWQQQLGLSEGLLSVVDITIAPIPLAINIINTGEALLIKHSLRYQRELNRIWGLWDDMQWHRDNPNHKQNTNT